MNINHKNTMFKFYAWFPAKLKAETESRLVVASDWNWGKEKMRRGW